MLLIIGVLLSASFYLISHPLYLMELLLFIYLKIRLLLSSQLVIRFLAEFLGANFL